MDTFAFIIHPIDPKRDIQRKFPLLARIANDWTVYHFAPWFPPIYLSEVTGISSDNTGKQIKGWLIACPLAPQHFWELPEKKVYRKIIETGRFAEKLGAKILGLGAYTSVVGDAGLTVAQALDIPVTTGDAYTIAVSVQAIQEAAQMMEIPMKGSIAAIVGATGAIGKVCAELLAEEVDELLLIARSRDGLEQLKDDLEQKPVPAQLKVSTDLHDIRNAQLILTVTSAVAAVIHPEYIGSGSIICDVARPRDVAAQVRATRDDVLVIDGGLVDVPGAVDFHFDFGLPCGKAYACMAETMALTLEGRFEDYTLGKEIKINRVREIAQIATRHGFRLNGFRSFEKPITEEQIERVRENVKKRLGHF